MSRITQLPLPLKQGNEILRENFKGNKWRTETELETKIN